MAIQVNGTTVIDNSRNLTNITSVDATTAAAIGSAGVGGGLTLLRTNTYSTSASYSYIDVTLDSGYNYHRLVYSMPVPETSWNGLWCIMGDAGTGLLSSQHHYSNMSGTEYNDYLAGAIRLTEDVHTNASADYIYGVMDIYNARTTNRTFIRNSILEKSTVYLGAPPQYTFTHAMVDYTNQNNKIRFTGNGSNLQGRSGRADFIQTYAV